MGHFLQACPKTLMSKVLPIKFRARLRFSRLHHQLLRRNDTYRRLFSQMRTSKSVTSIATHRRINCRFRCKIRLKDTGGALPSPCPSRALSRLHQKPRRELRPGRSGKVACAMFSARCLGEKVEMGRKRTMSSRCNDRRPSSNLSALAYVNAPSACSCANVYRL